MTNIKVDTTGSLLARQAALIAVKAAVAKITVDGFSVATHVTDQQYIDVANAAADSAIGAYVDYTNAPGI